MFDSFTDRLSKRLKTTLPGKVAQMQMMPRESDIDRFNFENKSNVKEGSVLILLYPHQEKIYLPLMKRPDYEGVHGGQVSFPGGKKEEGDKNLIETALREAEEEIGIKQREVKVVGLLTEMFIIASNFKVLPVVGVSQSKPEFIPDKFEVKEIIETDLHHLQKEDTRKEKELIIRDKYRLNAPYFDINGHVVWGATAMILSEFLAVLEEV